MADNVVLSNDWADCVDRSSTISKRKKDLESRNHEKWERGKEVTKRAIELFEMKSFDSITPLNLSSRKMLITVKMNYFLKKKLMKESRTEKL